jgi:uncharacterized protein YndB with AHSA1/START domain
MTKSSLSYTTPSEREFAAERVFNAPRELVWQVWTSPEHLTQWWGPKDWTLPVCEVDFRPGGVWFYCMRSPDGQESWGKATYREIVEPERIVYSDAFVDETGTPIEGTPEMLITVSFEDLGGKTKLVTHIQFPSAEELKAVLGMGMVEGLTETWDRLEAYLASI